MLDNQNSPIEKPLPLAERAAGRTVRFGEVVSNALGNDRRVLAAAFAPVDTKRSLSEGIEGGSTAVIPLGMVHGFLAFVALFTGDWSSLVVHGVLTGFVILAYYAIVYGRTIWPICFVLAWLVVEITCGRWLFDYRMGGSYMNIFALPVAILGVRAAWRRARLAKM